jgi:hypothetical protein
MAKTTISANPLSKKRTVLASDTDAVRIYTEQDVTDVLEDNKSFYNSIDERARWGEMTRVASIPTTVYYDLKRRGLVDDKEKFKAGMNDPDNRLFRTRPGRV